MMQEVIPISTILTFENWSLHASACVQLLLHDLTVKLLVSVVLEKLTMTL